MDWVWMILYIHVWSSETSGLALQTSIFFLIFLHGHIPNFSCRILSVPTRKKHYCCSMYEVYGCSSFTHYHMRPFCCYMIAHIWAVPSIRYSAWHQLYRSKVCGFIFFHGRWRGILTFEPQPFIDGHDHCLLEYFLMRAEKRTLVLSKPRPNENNKWMKLDTSASVIWETIISHCPCRGPVGIYDDWAIIWFRSMSLFNLLTNLLELSLLLVNP